MRVALLQLPLDSKSPAANIQGLIAGIHRAANTTPPPDLLVLPGSCDTGGVVPSRRLAESSLQSVREMIAWQARDWGVYIAAGLHCRRGSAVVPWAVLFDPDGDLVVQDPAQAADTDRPAQIGTWQTAVGTLGVVEPSVGGALAERQAAIEDGAFIAMPIRPDAGGVRERGQGAVVSPLAGVLRGGTGAFWGVAAPAGYNSTSWDEQGRGTFVCDPKGNIIASVENGEEAIVHAEISLVSAVPKL
ncbi:MAG: hypothetical protein ACYTFA_10190 [Planctomycetota bacterium]|jgi:hypothetical protein